MVLGQRASFWPNLDLVLDQSATRILTALGRVLEQTIELVQNRDSGTAILGQRFWASSIVCSRTPSAILLVLLFVPEPPVLYYCRPCPLVDIDQKNDCESEEKGCEDCDLVCSSLYSSETPRKEDIKRKCGYREGWNALVGRIK